jgi:SAM-dependent methyltransferase
MKVYETRVDMLYEVKHNGVIAELGVFRGDFSEQILEACKPKKLVLIDLWPDQPIQCGDADGNHLEFQNGKQLHSQVVSKFNKMDVVRILHGLTNLIKSYPENYFDMVYIDADHSYNAVLNDLINAYRVTKPDGIIMGHDYSYNLEKTKNTHYFGVSDAVSRFCVDYKQVMNMIAMDGCTSFGITIKK